jgi:hypothetical protein
VKYAVPVLLLLLATLASGQSTITADGEPITRLPYGGWKHDGPSKKEYSKEPASVTTAARSWVPHPFIYSGPSLLGNGYQTVAGNFGGGFLLNARRLMGDFEAYYMNAKKTNDATVNNRKGHERFLHGRVFYPLQKGYYLGGGAQWSETSTTNYTKKAWRQTFGGGRNYFAPDWSCRWQLLYVTKGSDRSSGVQGPEFQFWIPSPSSKSHFFYRQTLGIYMFHTTVTDPKDIALTALQTSHKSSAAFLDFTFGWKF